MQSLDCVRSLYVILNAFSPLEISLSSFSLFLKHLNYVNEFNVIIATERNMECFSYKVVFIIMIQRKEFTRKSLSSGP